jgi:hypothetical protein
MIRPATVEDAHVIEKLLAELGYADTSSFISTRINE